MHAVQTAMQPIYYISILYIYVIYDELTAIMQLYDILC